MKLSIVMVNFNTYEYTKNAINSIFEFTENIDFEIIVVDNNSKDNSADDLTAYFGNRIRLIKLDENFGTSYAFNIGLKQSVGEIVVWLNTDVLLFDNFFKKVIDFMVQNEDCGVCGGNLLNGDSTPGPSFLKNKLSLKSVRKDNSVVCCILHKIFNRKNKLFTRYNYSDKAKKIKGFISGADMFVKREVFEKTGGLDEGIFMYGEETEFQYRVLNETDYKIYSVPWARLIHFGGKSVSDNKFNEARERLFYLGTAMYFYKSFGKKSAIKYLKISKNGCTKFGILSKFVEKNKREEFLLKKGIIKKLIGEFDGTIK